MFGIILNDEWYESLPNWRLGFMLGLGMKVQNICL